MAGTREDQYSVAVTIDGKDYGVWDRLTGGSVDSDETKYRPGAMGAMVSLGGPRTFENITVVRNFDPDRDGTTLGYLLGRAGKGDVTATKQPLDRDGNAHGKPLVYKGMLKQISPPDANSSSNDAGLLSLEVSVSSVTG